MQKHENLNVAEWLDYLENRHAVEIQLGLQRIKEVAHKLDLLSFSVPVITVAGTNGKGSTVASLQAIYSAAGYQVATYTSPHLIHFNERICFNQQPISDADLCAAFLKIEKSRGDTHLTYFEMATLAALWYFKCSKPDVIILEVGMGGRQDATNILDADLAIITTIDFDHQEFLGDTKEKIGYEKAGILRLGKPAIYADSSPPLSIIATAAELQAPLLRFGEDYTLHSPETSLILEYAKNKKTYPLPKINLKAAAAALVASYCLENDLPVSEEARGLAMRAVSIKGRQQIVENEETTTIFDVAHNPQAVALLAQFLKTYRTHAKVHAVFSALKDKDLGGLIKPMDDYVDVWYPALLQGKRAADQNQLGKAFNRAVGFEPPEYFATPIAAYQAAQEAASTEDLIIVYGSFLTVSAVLSAEMSQEI